MAKINPDELTGDVLKAYNIIQKLKKSKNKNLKKKGEVLEKNFIEKLNKAKQVAESKKPVKAPTKKVATKKTAKKTVAKRKTAPKKRKTTVQTKVPFTKRASNLMKSSNISWAEAKQKVRAEIQAEKKALTKVAQTELQKLKKIVDSKDFQAELGKFPRGRKGRPQSGYGSDIQKDAGIKALPSGKRVSKSGKTYYEYRDNRSDVRQSSYPYLADGGTLPTPFGQAGLVGETGAMNETDLFAMGGDLPQGVHQYFGQTYSPAFTTPHGYAKGGKFADAITEVSGSNYVSEIDVAKGRQLEVLKDFDDINFEQTIVYDTDNNNKVVFSGKYNKRALDKLYEIEEGMMAKGGKTQGFNDKLDESLGNTKGKRSNKEQNYKDRRDESEAMEKKGGRRKYARVKTMDKNRRKRKTPMTLAKEIRKEGEKWVDAVKRASKMMKNK